MFYKVINKNSVIDAIFDPIYLCCQKGNNRLVRCNKIEAEGVLSSDGSIAWHVEGWKRSPALSLETVKLIEITPGEYEELKVALDEKKVVVIGEEEARISLEEITSLTLSEYKIKKMKEACAEAITQGIDVAIDGKKKHFDLTIEDQINLMSLFNIVNNGAETVSFHAKGEECRDYTAKEIQIIVAAVNQHRIYHTTYFNCLKKYITMLDVNNIGQVYYGMPIPEEYQTEALKSLLK